jgi:hypothetical protein
MPLARSERDAWQPRERRCQGNLFQVSGPSTASIFLRMVPASKGFST